MFEKITPQDEVRKINQNILNDLSPQTCEYFCIKALINKKSIQEEIIDTLNNEANEIYENIVNMVKYH